MEVKKNALNVEESNETLNEVIRKVVNTLIKSRDIWIDVKSVEITLSRGNNTNANTKDRLIPRDLAYHFNLTGASLTFLESDAEKLITDLIYWARVSNSKYLTLDMINQLDNFITGRAYSLHNDSHFFAGGTGFLGHEFNFIPSRITYVTSDTKIHEIYGNKSFKGPDLEVVAEITNYYASFEIISDYSTTPEQDQLFNSCSAKISGFNNSDRIYLEPDSKPKKHIYGANILGMIVSCENTLVGIVKDFIVDCRSLEFFHEMETKYETISWENQATERGYISMKFHWDIDTSEIDGYKFYYTLGSSGEVIGVKFTEPLKSEIDSILRYYNDRVENREELKKLLLSSQFFHILSMISSLNCPWMRYEPVATPAR